MRFDLIRSRPKGDNVEDTSPSEHSGLLVGLGEDLSAKDSMTPASNPVGSNYQSIMKSNLDIEEAEQELLSNIEAQSQRTSTTADGFRPAIRNERPPLGVAALGLAFGNDTDDNERGAKSRMIPIQSDSKRRPTLKNLAHKTIQRQRVQKIVKSMRHHAGVESSTDETANEASRSNKGHRRAQTLLASIDQVGVLKGDNPDKAMEGPSDPFLVDFTSDIFATHIDPSASSEIPKVSHRRTQSQDYSGLSFLLGEEDDIDVFAEETVPSSQHPLLGPEARVPSATETVLERRRLMKRLERTGLQWKNCCLFALDCLHPISIWSNFIHVIFHSAILAVLFLCSVAWVLYYYFNNPEIDFMPGTATVSWWLNFAARQLVLMDFARLTEYILIDLLTMSSTIVVQFLGPWVTILFLQSKGWPFVLGCWGIYAMLLLHGDNKFQTHWLYWTGIPIYSEANSGSYILTSTVYLRVLIGMLLAGVATALKRTILTLYFGRKSLETYKPKLEEILSKIVVITEVAELAAEATDLSVDDADTSAGDVTNSLVGGHKKKRRQRNEVRWSTVQFQPLRLQRDRSESTEESEIVTDGLSDSMSEMDLIDVGSNDEGMELQTPYTLPSAPAPPPRRSTSMASKASSEATRIRNLLDKWQEPMNKLDKTSDSTVSDVLKFRKALTYMDLEHPFGESFGRASNRDELIKSSHAVYQNLLKLVPGSSILPNSILLVLAEKDDGTIDKEMKKSIVSLFRANAGQEISLLSFVQTCDTIYKKLRYFRASVGNSSVIDRVLENVIDAFFGFGLAMVILSILNFNPWPLLVSISTLLVSLAFAIGPTAAKTIEGIMLVVGTRPYDIGDRIMISDSPGAPCPDLKNSWFVEDIDLFRTTLRMAATNEVATVNNASIAGARITNCARSNNATISLLLKFHINIHSDGQSIVSRYRQAVETYIQEHRVAWDSLMLFRCEEIDADKEFAMYRLRVRSHYTWQAATRLTTERGLLHQFCIECAKEMEVSFDSPPSQQILYYGGTLVNGVVTKNKRDLLLDPDNVMDDGHPMSMHSVLEKGVRPVSVGT